jgi:DNA-binding CsgD family transcriptional regulator
LAFVARRIASDRIVLLATHRHGGSAPMLDRTLPVVDLGPLDRDAATALLDQGAARLDTRTRALILEVAKGNPLALLELPQTVRAAAGHGVDRLPLSERLENSFLARIDDLGAATRTALEIAALDDSGDVAEIVAAVEVVLGSATSVVLDPAISADLVGVEDGLLRFRHPLIRSSIHQRLAPENRKAGHAALARVVRRDPERSTWHRAAATSHPEPGLATALEQSADQALDRGATSTAVRALERSAKLSEDGPARRRRLYRAATLAYAGGWPDDGHRLRVAHRVLVHDEHDRLRHEWLNELAGTDRGGEHRVGVLLDLARRASQVDDGDLALHFLRASALRCWNFCPDRPVGKEVIAAGDGLVLANASSRATLLAQGAPLQSADDVLKLVAGADSSDRDATTAYQLGHAAACVGAFDVSEGLFGEAADALRAEGRLHTLGTTLVLLSWSALRRGRWSTTVAAADEGARLCAETDQPFWLACALAAHGAVMGLRGESEAADALVRDAHRVVDPHQFAAANAVILIAQAATASGRGEHDRAFEYLARLHDPHDPGRHAMHGLWSLASLADAAAASGELVAARAILAGLHADVRATSSPAGRMNLDYAEAILASDETVEERLRTAVRSDLATWPHERHRLLLHYGSWLRRHHRIRESRDYLRTARDGFDQLGSRPWARRAREELRAAGEQSSSQVTEPWDELSPQEAQIASMVAEGLTNRQIGERLFLSHRTIGSHLYRIFPKLGITARAQLGAALATEARRAVG